MQNFGTSRDVLIRMHLDKNQSSADLSQKVLAILQDQDKTAELRRVEFVGPQIGSELVEYGALALLITAVGIVLYLWMRFEWRFGLSGIIANLHDVVIILGFFAFFQWEFSLPVLAAVLAVLGYSVNESVVVFDRVRENFRKMRKATTAEVIDSAITGVISRTIITHLCTQMMVTTMLVFGGPALHYFAMALTIGILFGIYSSVLVASPLVMWLGARREQFIVPTKKNPAAPATSTKAPWSSEKGVRTLLLKKGSGPFFQRAMRSCAKKGPDPFFRVLTPFSPTSGSGSGSSSRRSRCASPACPRPRRDCARRSPRA